MKQFTIFVIKESRHIFRDKRTMLILFGMPVVMMLLFGFAISTDVRNVRSIVVTSCINNDTQQMIEALHASPYFTLCGKVATPQQAERMIRDQQADLAIVFQRSTTEKGNKIQIIADGADPNMAQQYANYASLVLAGHLYAGRPTEEMADIKLLYNPSMKSAYNFVPGIMGMLLMLVCAMMTSISIVREKERGTMEVLLVSPVRPLIIIIAKAVPYLALAILILTTILLLSAFLLQVPMLGNLPLICGVSLIYILMALSLGLLISTIARVQLVALLMSALMLLMPSILLSGMMFPIESMPLPLQWVSALMPPRYYISAMRKLMIMGAGWESIVSEVSVLVFMLIGFLCVALVKFKKRLE